MRSPLKFRRASEAFTLRGIDTTLEAYKNFMRSATQYWQGNIYYYELHSSAIVHKLHLLEADYDYTATLTGVHTFTDLLDAKLYKDITVKIPEGTKLAIMFDNDYSTIFSDASEVRVVGYLDDEESWFCTDATEIPEVKDLVEALIKLRTDKAIFDIRDKVTNNKFLLSKISYTESFIRPAFLSPILSIQLQTKRLEDGEIVDNSHNHLFNVQVNLNSVMAFDAYDCLVKRIVNKLDSL